MTVATISLGYRVFLTDLYHLGGLDRRYIGISTSSSSSFRIREFYESIKVRINLAPEPVRHPEIQVIASIFSDLNFPDLFLCVFILA